MQFFSLSVTMSILSFIADDNALRVKQQVKQKCRYLDEKNIVVSHHLLSEALSSSSEGSDVSEKLTPECKASQDNTPPIQSPVVLPAEESSLSQSTSDTDRFPANNDMITNLVIHKRDIICGLRSVKTSSSELKRTLPLIWWAPATSCVQMTEEPVAWRYKGFVTVNREASHGELPQLWKRASGKKLERCHGSMANMALPQMQSPNKVLSVTRTRPVIRKAAWLTTGHRGVQVRDSHVKQNFCWKTEAKHKDLLNSGPAPLEDTHKKVLYKYVWRATKSESSMGLQDDDHYHRTEGLNPMCYTNVSRLPVSCLLCLYYKTKMNFLCNLAVVLVNLFVQCMLENCVIFCNTMGLQVLVQRL